MKIVFCIILIALSPFLCDVECRAQAHKLDSVKIEIEGFGTETFADVSCEAFDNTFKKTKQIKVFLNYMDLSKFQLLTKGFKQVKERSLDARGKIVYYYRKSTSKILF